MGRRPRLLLRPAAGDSSPVPGPPKYRVAGVVWSAGDGPRKRARRGALASSTAERFGPAALPPSSFERLPSRVRAPPLGATGKKKPSSYAALLTEPALAAFACSEGSHLALTMAAGISATSGELFARPGGKNVFLCVATRSHQV